MSEVTFLNAWYEILDSNDDSRALDLVTDDFEFSILYSGGPGVFTEFSGGRTTLEEFLKGRPKSERLHDVFAYQRMGNFETAFGRSTQGGSFEASFNATAQLDPVSNKARRLLICRTPAVEFSSNSVS